jgi:hypothetical protein
MLFLHWSHLSLSLSLFLTTSITLPGTGDLDANYILKELPLNILGLDERRVGYTAKELVGSRRRLLLVQVRWVGLMLPFEFGLTGVLVQLHTLPDVAVVHMIGFTVASVVHLIGWWFQAGQAWLRACTTRTTFTGTQHHTCVPQPSNWKNPLLLASSQAVSKLRQKSPSDVVTSLLDLLSCSRAMPDAAPQVCDQWE